MSAPDEKTRDYRVGYGRTPEETRFRPGQSGNPRGKAPGRKNLKTELLDELSAKIPVSANGRRRQLSNQTVIVKRMVADAARGDARARDQLLRMIEQLDRNAPSDASSLISQQEDQEIMERFRRRLLSEIRRSDSRSDDDDQAEPER